VVGQVARTGGKAHHSPWLRRAGGVARNGYGRTVVPTGRRAHHDAASGLPIGVQVVAPAWRDDLCLQVAAQLEQTLPWRDRRPTIA
jgi:hypothetical protein